MTVKQKLLGLAVGEHCYIETELGLHVRVSRNVYSLAAMDPDLMDYRFTVKTYTAIGTRRAGDILMLVRVKREA